LVIGGCRNVSLNKAILVRYGEIMLKGLNRRSFEKKLAENIKSAIRAFGATALEIEQGRIFVEPLAREGAGFDFDGAAKKIANVFGVVSVSVALRTESEQNAIRECAEHAMRAYMEENAPSPPSPSPAYKFKVETKRADKRYPMASPEVSRDVGEYLLGRVSELAVDVNSPDVILYVEVRGNAYAYTDKIKGFGGLPLGTNGKSLLLLSGGIDSPVAGFMMAKRGVEVEAVHFYSHPYTDERSKEKVVRLAEILAGYSGSVKLHVVPFTDIQLAIRDHCREEYLTIVMRRFMMVIADRLAKKIGAQALVTGEAMGQVASQTIMSLSVTDRATDLPVFRPLIGMDKNEVVEYARKIGTFETSILPYEDCCTVFTPKHPRTKPRLADVEREENRVPEAGKLTDEAVANTECVTALPGYY
jgi:thiamine biosynthesis protein ThiI